MSDVNASLQVGFNRGGASIQRSLNVNFDIADRLYVAGTPTIGIADEALDLGDVVKTGLLLLHNLEARYLLSAPPTPVITPQGTTGAATWSYKIVAKQADSDGNVVAYTAASSVGTTATGKATLTGTDFNRITWTADAKANGGYDIYRTAHGTSPTTNGLIRSVAAGVTTLDDTGLAGDGSTAPAAAKTNVIQFGDDGTHYPIVLQGGDIALIPWASIDYSIGEIHAKAENYACALEYLLLSQ